MKNPPIKNIIIAIVLFLGLLLIWIFKEGFYPKTPAPKPIGQSAPKEVDMRIDPDGEAKVLTTKPDPLDHATLLPNQVIEITFNKKLNNDPADLVIEPKLKYNAEAVNNGQTVKITPLEPYKLGSEYSIRFKSGYDLDGGKKLGKDFEFRFKTIEYRGI